VIPQTSIAAAQSTSATPPTNNPYGPQTVLPAPGASASEPIYVNHLARLNTDGTLDTTFYPDPDSDVLSLSIQSNGAIVVGGILTSFAPNYSHDRDHPQLHRPRERGRLARRQLQPQR
jgi:hypothetical protein